MTIHIYCRQCHTAADFAGVGKAIAAWWLVENKERSHCRPAMDYYYCPKCRNDILNVGDPDDLWWEVATKGDRTLTYRVADD